MKSLLNALHEGRLIELPTTEKEKTLEYLALLIEAVPDIGGGQDLVNDVKKREAAANTGLGNGVACPHVRTKHEGELLCAVGWSPGGIDYGAADGKKVHLVIMYYIPDSQRNSYLKEISGLARAITESEDIQSIFELADLPEVRNKLLDWVEIAVNKAVPDTKARMIKLEEKQATFASGQGAEQDTARAKWTVIPFSLLVPGEGKPVVLSQNQEIIDAIEPIENVHRVFTGARSFELAGFQITVLSTTSYSKNRTMYECVAVRGAEGKI
jgi:mannitol/fructose-specific phosphotransferase system IIA component (Ntr-type)